MGTDQREFLELVAAIYGDNGELGPIVVLTRWKPDDADIDRLIDGEDIYIAIQTGGHPLQPLQVQVGSDGFAQEGQ